MTGRSLHIGFDISQTGSQKAGCGYYTHAMIQAMIGIAPENRYSVFPSFGDFYFDPMMPLRNPYPGENVQFGPRHLTRESAGAFWNSSDLETAIGRPDIIHSNNFWMPLEIYSSKLIYTHFDLGFLQHPDWTTEPNRIGCFEGSFRSAVAADWVVTISEASRTHYVNTFPSFPADRIRVVYPCSRFSDVERKGTAPTNRGALDPDGFWLCVGTIEPRKNQRLLVTAFASYLRSGGRPMPLVFAGGKGWLMEDFEEYVSALGIQDHVKLLGYVTDDEMIWLYRNCYANFYPSIFEGFGLPVLEGMQFGAATVSSNSSSMPEVAGDAAILLSPSEAAPWAQTMLMLSKNSEQRSNLRAAGRKQANTFSWDRSASDMLSIYHEAADAPKRAYTAKTEPVKNELLAKDN